MIYRILFLVVLVNTTFIYPNALSSREITIKNHIEGDLENRYSLGIFFTPEVRSNYNHAKLIVMVMDRYYKTGIIDKSLDRKDAIAICADAITRAAENLNVSVYDKQEITRRTVEKLHSFSDNQIGLLLYPDQVHNLVQQELYALQIPATVTPAPVNNYSSSYYVSSADQKRIEKKAIVDRLAHESNTSGYLTEYEKSAVISAQKKAIDNASETHLNNLTPELIRHRLHQGFSGKAIDSGKAKNEECAVCFDAKGAPGVKGCKNWHATYFICNNCIDSIKKTGNGKCPMCRESLATIK